MCRVNLLENYFSKACVCNMSKSDTTSVFVWAPTGTYINRNYEQELINNLTEGNLFKVKGQSWGFTSRSTARVILGQVLRIATCGTRTHRGDSL